MRREFPSSSHTLAATLILIVLFAAAAAADQPVTKVAAKPGGAVVSLNATSYEVSESGGTVEITVNLSTRSDGSMGFVYTTSDGTAVSDGDDPDFVAKSETIEFPIRMTQETIDIHINSDELVEGDEVFTFELIAADGDGVTIGDPAVATVAILDDDVAASAGWSIEAGEVTLTANPTDFTPVTFQAGFAEPPVVVLLMGNDDDAPSHARLRNVTATGFEVAQVEPPDEDGVHGAETVHYLAVEPGRHELPTGSVIQAGFISTSAIQHGGGVTGPEGWDAVTFDTAFGDAPVVVTSLQTMVNEGGSVPDEPSVPWLVAAIRIVSPTGFDVALDRGQAADGQARNAETVGWVAIEAGVLETLPAADAGTVVLESVDVSAAIDGGCSPVAFAGAYTETPLVIGHLTSRNDDDGGWLRRCTVTTTGADVFVDEDDAGDTQHGNESAGFIVVSRPFNSDMAPELAVSFEADIYGIDEEDGSIAIDVTLSFDPPEAVGVTVVTADGTATAGDGDYTALSQQLTWLPGGSLTQTVEVSIGDDFIDEGDENFTLSLDPASLVGPLEVGATTSATITILDDADLAGIVVTPTSGLTTTEDPASPDNTATFTVVLTSQPQPGTNVSITLASSDPTEGVPTPTSLVFDTLTWNAPQTVTVTGQDDAEDDDAVGYQIELQPASSADLGYHGLDPADVSLYNLDDEISSSLAYFDPPGYRVQETDGLVTITVRLQSPQPTLTEIDYATADSSADWSDYTAESGRLQFLIGETEKTFTVEIFEDTQPERDEHIELELRDAATGQLLHTSAITIFDDDHDPSNLHRVVYSVGVDQSNLLTRPARALINWNVATFDVFIDEKIGVGDILTTATDRYIITRRNSNYQLEVRTLIGHECDRRPVTDVVSITRAFNSLAQAVAGASDTDHLGTADLVAANLELEFSCFADGPDTQPVTVAGWTTGFDNTIRIFSPIDEYSVGVPQRSSGVAGAHGAGLQVTNEPCLTLDVGDLTIEGLGLSCTGDDSTPLAGIVVGADATGEIRLSDNLVVLQPSGAGDRTGITTDPGATASLMIWNNVITGIGDGGSAGHVGILIDGEDLSAHVFANTIFGGANGIRIEDATVIAANNLVDASTVACYAGDFDLQSHHNLSSDATAPGSSAILSADVAFSQPGAGDHHLVCDPVVGWAEISTTPTNDQIEVLFDGDPFTPLASNDVNPAFVQFAFPVPQEFEGIEIALGWGSHHRWMVAAADTVFDMENESGSYTIVVPWRDTYSPDPQWDDVEFGTPLTTSVLRLIVEKFDGDDRVHICEIELQSAGNQACNVGANLSLDEDLPFIDDIDELERFAPWDVGADEGNPIEISWRSDWVEAFEEEGSVELELELTRPSSFPVTVHLESYDGEATVVGGDYDPVSTTVTFPPGEVRLPVPITVTSDSVPEGQEVFQIQLSQAGAAMLGNQRWATIRINDERQVPAVNINPAVSNSENTAWFGIPVTLDFGIAEPVAVDYRITGSTATEGSDFTGVSGAVVFAPWDTVAMIDVRVLNDSWFEADETFLVEITAAANAELGDTLTSVVTILNDDVSVLPTVQFATSSWTVGESAGVASVTLQLSEPAGPGLSVNVGLSPETATPVVDYTDVSGSYAFTQGSDQLTIDIPIIPDGDTETDETILLELSNPSAGLQLGNPVQATLTILDDDGPPIVSFETATAGVVEAAGAVVLIVVLDKVADVPVNVQVDTTDGSAAAGPDYQALSQILTIPTDQTSGVVTITVFDDGQPEDDETFNVTLTSPSGADLGAPSTAVVTILGDGSLPSLSFAPETYSIYEQAGSVDLEIKLDEPPSTQVTVQVTSADGDAIAGEDYTAVDQIVTFGVGDISKTLTIEILDDAIYEYAESFAVSLSAPLGANLGTPTAATVTIRQSEFPPFVYLADGGGYTATYAANETSEAVVIPVRLSDHPSSVEARVDYMTTEGTATAGVDFTPVSGTLVFAPGEVEHLITVPITVDAVADDGETFQITLSNEVECTLDYALPDDAVVTIYDYLEVRFSQPSFIAAEDGGNIDLEVTLTEPQPSEVFVLFASIDGTAIAGEDYSAVSGGVTFPAWEQVRTINVPITDDGTGEGNETFTVELRRPSAAPIGEPASVEVTIFDDEILEVHDLRVLHVEPDLVHLAWQSLPVESTEIFRRDADLQDAWQLLATITDGTSFWRDFLPERGVRHEYRIALTDNGGLNTGEATIALTASVPLGADEAAVTVAPGMASVIPGSGTAPAEAHPFAGVHDYVFTLQPDPGPTFVGCTVDVYLDEDPAAADPNELSQPIEEPFGGRARDELGCVGPVGTPVISSQPCDGSICDVVISGLTPGPHRVRFVLTDSAGYTAERAIVQDFHPWLSVNGEDISDYPVPFPLLFSENVNVQQPSFVIQGPPQTGIADSLDCADAADGGRFDVSANVSIWIHDEYILDPDQFGRALLSVPSDRTWSDNETRSLVSRWQEPREIGRNILKRGNLTEDWGGRQTIDSSLSFFTYLTVDLGIQDDQQPVVTWVDPLVVNGDPTTELVRTIWFRVEDHDHDVDVSTVTVANLTRDGGAAAHPAYYADPASQLRPEGSLGWFVASVPLIDGTNNLSIHVEDRGGHVIDETAFSLDRFILIPGEYPEPVISEPQADGIVSGGYQESVDATLSTVPAGFDVWLAVLVDDGTFPMAPVFTTDQLSGSFIASNDHPGYRIRLVIAESGAMPSDSLLRGDEPPCELFSSDLQCDADEVAVTRWPGLDPFEVAYAFPDEVMLRFGAETPQIERSSDGGQTWQHISVYNEWWEEYFFIDTDVEPGVTYYYRVGSFYLGNTKIPPGQPVQIPVWTAPQIVPRLDDLAWNCPSGASRWTCYGTLDAHLAGQDGESLAEATIRIFLNEGTFQRTDGLGDPLHIEWPANLDHFAGGDVPGCVNRKAEPDLEITVPLGQDEIDVSLPGAAWGANGLRFEVEMPSGARSERATIIALHEVPAFDGYFFWYPTMQPLLFGATVADTSLNLLGLGPASRYSPDCNDGDLTYWYSRDPYYDDAIYLNWLSLEGQDWVLIGTDEDGLWSHSYEIADGTYNLHWEYADDSPYGYGNLGRELLDANGALVTDKLATYVYSDASAGTIPITLDSTITDLEPDLSYVADSLLIDAPGTEEDGVIRFRITDADQDLDMSTVRTYNCSIESCTPGQPGTVPYSGFYAINQWGGADGHFGWFVVELPLSLANGGVNELRFCAEDAAGNPLGTVAEPCVAATVTRTSPLVFAVITTPTDSSYLAGPGEIVALDGSASSIPAGGVAVWTVGEQLVSGFPWYDIVTTDQVPDAAELITSFVMPTGPANARKGRLIVAASPADLPGDYWPIDGLPPCLRSQGEGRCDSAEFILTSSCSSEPQPATLVVEAPTGPLNVGPHEEFVLEANVTSPPETFAYRWTVYRFSDSELEWPVMTLGDDGAGDGFSLDNDDLLITASGQHLGPGAYLIKPEARSPATGCETTWYHGSAPAVSLRVSHTFDGVAPGQVVEGGSFRVYSRTWAEGELGWVFIDEDIDNPPGEFMYSGIVQPGGYIQITPNPADLNAIGSAWIVSVGTEEDGSGRSFWLKALNVVTARDAITPHVVTNEEDTSCGGADTECEHAILPGQTWQGEWGEAGDEDGFAFLAGAGTEVSITLERIDLTLPPQHPDAPTPEIFLAGPDGIVFASSEPLSLDATGTSVNATTTIDGKQTILVRTSKGTGHYLVNLTVTAEGGNGSPVFGYTPERTYFTTEARPDALLTAPLLDPFGNPITGANVLWEQGVVCGMGDFCGNGTTTPVRSSTGGFAVLDLETTAGADPLWKPSVTLAPTLKHQPLDRGVVDERLARARAERPVLGTIRTSGRAIVSTNLTDVATAKALKADAQQRALARGGTLLKDGNFCQPHDSTCPSGGELVFRTAQLALDPGDDLVDVEVSILEGGAPTESLDGQTILTNIPLSLKITATVRPAEGPEYTVDLNEPAGVILSKGAGGALSDGVNTCAALEVTAGGGFTYLNSREANMYYSYDEFDGSPCCWRPTEFINATVVVDAEVDDGGGGTIRISKRASTKVESIPRPEDPCEIRPWPPGFAGETPQIAGIGTFHLPSGETSMWDWVGSVYSTDACGNRTHLTAADPQIRVTGVSPADPEVWAEVDQSEHSWQWNVLLRSTHCTTSTPPCDLDDYYFIPDDIYNISFGIDPAPTCGSDATTYDQLIDYAATRPVIQLKWEQNGDEPIPPMASPGSALRNPTTGEVIAWRVRPGESGVTTPLTSFTDIPVRLYVAERLIWFDADGNVIDSFRKVDDAEICVGQVHLHWDWDANPDPGWNVTTTTCDQVFIGETTVLAYTEPDTSGNYFDGYIGVAAGVSKVPDQPGSYALIAEPLDEAFRRGDAWRIATEVTLTVGESSSEIGTYMKKFEAGGGVFLDEGFEPIDEIDVGRPRSVYVKAILEDSGPEVVVDVQYTEESVVVNQTQLTLERVGTLDSMAQKPSVYLGRLEVALDLHPAAKAQRTKLLPGTTFLVGDAGMMPVLLNGAFLTGCRVQSTLNPVSLDVFLPDDGEQVAEEDGQTPSVHVSVNNDDDDGDEADDYSNGVIDNDEDRRDMVRLRAFVNTDDPVQGTIRLEAIPQAFAEGIRVFDQDDTELPLPAVLDAAVFNGGPVAFMVEGMQESDGTVKLVLDDGLENPADYVHLIVGQPFELHMTFDDGPHDGTLNPESNFTLKVQETLRENSLGVEIPATFYVQTHAEGRGAEPNGQTVLSITSSAGHVVGIHTGCDEPHLPMYNHVARVALPAYDVDGDEISDGNNALESDLIRAVQRIQDLTSIRPWLVRPTYGTSNDAVLNTYSDQNLRQQNWNVLGEDSNKCNNDPDCASKELYKQIKSKARYVDFPLIVLLHDTEEATKDNLDQHLIAMENACQHAGKNVSFVAQPVQNP